MEQNLNLSDIIFNAINKLLSQLFSSIDNTIYSVLDNITFIQPDILENSAFKKILGESHSEGILLICNSLILGFILYYAINYLISHLTYSKIEAPNQFVFKAIIFVALMNGSIWICEQIILIISLVSSSICSLGENLFKNTISFSSFIDTINKNIYFSNISLDVFSFNGIVKSFTSFGLINLVFTYSLRYIMIQIFILLSPFAFLTLINHSSEWFFKVWLKNFVSLLLVQVLVSIILVLAFSIELYSDNLISKLLYIGIIYALIRANNFIKEIFGSITTSVNSNLSVMNNFGRTLLIIYDFYFKEVLCTLFSQKTIISNQNYLVLSIILQQSLTSVSQ